MGTSRFAENLKKLPAVSHLAALHLLDEQEQRVAVIENQPGSQGSLVIYHYLAQTFGAITPEAAACGLELYAEHAEEARRFPGKHPNIDRLRALISEGAVLRAKPLSACW